MSISAHGAAGCYHGEFWHGFSGKCSSGGASFLRWLDSPDRSCLLNPLSGLCPLLYVSVGWFSGFNSFTAFERLSEISPTFIKMSA